MIVLITGSHGQLGSDVARLCREQGLTVYAPGRRELDITDSDGVLQAMSKIQPDAVIHCAAYTAVDAAETDADAAYAVNAMGTRNVAVAAQRVGAKLVYMSTDYVFDGSRRQAIAEYDSPNPMNVYGRSKLAGEQLVQTLCSRYFIVRTSWVFGATGNNFVKTMLKLGEERDRLRVVHDQHGSPTYTKDVAAFLLALAATSKYGIYHASNSGSCTWYEFAAEIFRQAKMNVEVIPCTSEEFPRPAVRPAYSVLDHMAIRTSGFELLPSWPDALHRCLVELGARGIE